MNNDCEKYKTFLMGLMDNELTPEEAGEVNSHLIRCKNCRDEYQHIRETADKLEFIAFNDPHDEVLEKLWKSPYTGLTRNFSILMIIGGWLALVVYAIYELLRSPGQETFPKMAVAVIIVGFVFLLTSVIRERIKTYKSDAYKEVER